MQAINAKRLRKPVCGLLIGWAMGELDDSVLYLLSHEVEAHVYMVRSLLRVLEFLLGLHRYNPFQVVPRHDGCQELARQVSNCLMKGSQIRPGLASHG